MIGVDRLGAIYKGRDGGDAGRREWYVEHTNLIARGNETRHGGADLSGRARTAGLVQPQWLKKNESRPHRIRVLANPTPEVMPEQAAPYVAVMATPVDDLNQINNVFTVFVFRGAIDCRATDINEEMKLAAAHAIA